MSTSADTRQRVLVVDDDKAVRESLRRSLEYNGYDVVLASDGAEALASIGTARPDVVVMDVMMPRLGGLETTRALRAAGHDLPGATGSRAWTRGPTTTSPSPSRSPSCWRGCAPCCAGSPPPRAPTTRCSPSPT